MQNRNLSPQKMFTEMANNHTPKFRFTAWGGSFNDWKAAATSKVIETLGEKPPKVDPNPELVAEWIDGEVTKLRYLIEVAPYISAVVQVNLPKMRTGRQPAILCWHGHGAHGKDTVMGNVRNDSVKESIRVHNYDYGHQMAAAGFATFAIDWIGCGERNDNVKPHCLNHDPGRDWCNLYYLSATMLGMTNLSINLAHGSAATDFVCTLPQIDPSKLGVMGLSGGGTMTLWTALTDSRFRAAEIICYSDLWAKFGVRDTNHCGMQVAPGLYNLVDVPDLQGLLAPMPLLVDIGIYDSCFQIENAMECYRQVKAIYSAAKAAGRLDLDLFGGEHAWGGNKSVAFFEKYL